MDDDEIPVFFRLFNEIAILAQLSATLLERRLPHGLLTSHFAVLNHLVRVGDGRTPVALARAFQTPKATMTHTLGGLTRHGLVEARPNPRDGRSKQIWITQAGRDFRAEAISAVAPDMAAIAERYASADAAALVPELTRLREIMDAMRDPRPTPHEARDRR
jgi:DNA-binding MarR family transcriptional regulator